MISNHVCKISCVVVTDTAPEEVFIDNFMGQIYPEKEMVIVSQVPFEGEWKDVLLVNSPQNLDSNWARDLAIELTTGEIICWWEPQDDPMWLTKRLRKEPDDKFFPKLEFYKSGNMLYCGTDVSLNGEYWSKE